MADGMIPKLAGMVPQQPTSAVECARRLREIMNTSASGTIPRNPTPAAARNPLELYSHTQLIHEMLRRGYAVMKVPEGGKPDLVKD